ncbi:MAG: GGDEF domain-containing protein [Lachnospiraceae bacterium]|nr:GGDEF domain-containing protein [Lachnospiraceae bacterium]
MKRKIAVFANAWSEKNLSDALEGIKCVAKEKDIDLFVFISHAAPGMNANEQREEKRIYQLPDFRDFDGLIVFSSTMNFDDLVIDARDRAAEARIPAISIGSKVDGMVSVEMSNKATMRELVEHLVTCHEVSDVEFIAGSKGSENSDARVDAWREVFEEHNLETNEERVHYTDWSTREAIVVVEEILARRKENLPDAIICANDFIAMGVSGLLNEVGIRMPEDIIVTGYDYTYDGQVFSPALCTVGQNDYLVGQTAAEKLINMISGGVEENVVINNIFINNQSCGCEREGLDELRIKECNTRYYNRIKALEFGWSNSWISHSLLKSPKPEDIRENLDEYLGRSKIFNNGTTYILEDAKAKLYFADKKEEAAAGGYSDELDVLAAVERRSRVPGNKINKRELIPGYKKVDGDSKLYMFMPIHFMDGVFGYAVVEDWLVGISTGKIKIFLDSFNQAVEKLEQNIKLENLNELLQDLYTKDSLTGLYNRFGFNSEGVILFNRCKANNSKMVLMFVDINRMKLINDYYGHLQGDMAIKTVAEVIRNSIPQEFKAIRFGGDEFLIVGEYEDEDGIKTIQQNIMDGVKNLGKSMNYPFYLSVSCGYLHFVPSADDSLDTYIKQADESMYEIKAYMHTSDKELKEFVEKCANSRENDIL